MQCLGIVDLIFLGVYPWSGISGIIYEKSERQWTWVKLPLLRINLLRS